jgi:PRC-barrel domain
MPARKVWTCHFADVSYAATNFAVSLCGQMRHPRLAAWSLKELQSTYPQEERMANHGMLRNYRFSEAAEDIRGSKVYGLNDEKLGKIDDVIFDYATGEITYVVVDTGGWLTSKKFVVPVEKLRQSLEHDDDFSVNLNKQQTESFPPYDEGDLESDAKWADYEGRYRSKWATGPVMHREGTDHNITPTPQQMAQQSPRFALDASLLPAVIRL